MSEKKKSGVHFNEHGEIIRDSKDVVEPDVHLKAFTARLEHLASDGKKAMQDTGKHFKDVVDNGIVGPTIEKAKSNHNMPAWGEDYIEKMLTGEEKGDDMEYE